MPKTGSNHDPRITLLIPTSYSAAVAAAMRALMRRDMMKRDMVLRDVVGRGLTLVMGKT